MAKPGGRIPPDNRGPQAKGIGKNSKRHDLERPQTPGLHDSDLQQGDVQALEQGQRIAPVQTQAPAVAPRGGATQRAVAAPQQSTVNPNDPMSIIEGRLGGTLPLEPQSPGLVNAKGGRNAAKWMNFMTMLSNHPTASTVTRSAARAQRQAVLMTPPPPNSSMYDLNTIDDFIEQTLLNEGF
jgi:hypothetical protein